MKNLLINQPAGIGDILATQKIVDEYSKNYKVYYPVKDSILWLKNYLDNIYSFSEVNGLEVERILNLDACHFRHPGYNIMVSKFIESNVSLDNYISHINIKRNLTKEDELFSKKVKSSYRLICPWYGTPDINGGGMAKKEIPMSLELDNIIMNIEPGYTLFDWIKIIENAEEIHITDSCLMFLVERYDCKDKNPIAYSRHPHTKELEGLFQKNWKYVV